MGRGAVHRACPNSGCPMLGQVGGKECCGRCETRRPWRYAMPGALCPSFPRGNRARGGAAVRCFVVGPPCRYAPSSAAIRGVLQDGGEPA